ncbi:MAG: hypothetical protein ACK6D3_08690 [Planctomycetaceae bacterium]|jgi:hypothetical protein
MGAIATISIDLNKLDKSKIVHGKNGSQYYNLNISVNDQTDQYGNNIQVTEPQSKEQREAKAPRVFYGNGAVRWTDGKIVVAETKPKF